MNPKYLQALQTANQLLQAKRSGECLQLCDQLLRQIPNEPNALQLVALAYQQSGNVDAADKGFKAALRAAPKSPQPRLAYATFLRQLGQAEQAEQLLRETLTIAPEFPDAWHALARLLFKRDALEEAMRCAGKSVQLAPRAPPFWELAAAIAQRQGDPQEAIRLCRQGLSHTADAPRLHYSLGQLLRQECDFAGAADAYERARNLGFEQPELYRNRAEALLDSGDINAALQCADEGVTRFPGHALLQKTAAQLSFSSGAERDHLEKLRRATREQPGNPALWQTLVELMKRVGEEAAVESVLAEARRRGCPDTPNLGVLAALDRARRGEEEDALADLQRLSDANPDSSYVRQSYAMQLLRCREAERAAALCERWLTDMPYDQTLLAYRGTALQLLGDPREAQLLDYENMVVPVQVPVPKEFASCEEYFGELRRVLEALHHTNAQPIEQSVRGGTQTNGFLFRLKEPLLLGLEKQLQEAIATALREMPSEAKHPFWGRNTRPTDPQELRMAGAWSVRLQDQGYHANHIHPEGWISSALYISLPDEVQQGDGTEGHIQFGRPMRELGLELEPRRIVKPEVGTLVLFPSYMWHGTVPFHSEQPRITVAFDLLPGA